MKCKISGRVMNDQDPPMWVPLRKEEGVAKMSKGYLICKSIFDTLEETLVDSKE